MPGCPERQSQHLSEFPDAATKSRCAVPCTNRAFMDDVEASGIGSEREADSPVCWKQWKCEQEMERLEGVIVHFTARALRHLELEGPDQM